ncbi:hypothetical protein [Corynebacterium comes]|uniref:DUF3618 domain-containing protein n=1 Tax=Corynebacterium comes TaxID=2675218 RepID=A0A6B8VQS3_9CORY|nr:hypothetical protein [Corynebacterium comes]QGU05409.1 hypothetical protein CETAM_10825 [Corynebacterium comes]
MATSHEHGTRPQDAAKDEAAQVAGQAKAAAKDVGDSARREARQITGEATDQIRSLVNSARDEAFVHASTQQEKLAGHSRIVSDDLQRISRGEPPQSDLVGQLLTTVTTRVEGFTTALETREPADLLRDVRRFAARRPVAFLAAAAGIGLLAGRLTRGLSDGDDEREFDGRYRIPSEPGAYGPPATTSSQDVPETVTAARSAAGFGEFPDTTDPTDATGTLRPSGAPDAAGFGGPLPGEGFADADPARDPFTDFERPEDRR